MTTASVVTMAKASSAASGANRQRRAAAGFRAWRIAPTNS
jgi:hypothetical protein